MGGRSGKAKPEKRKKQRRGPPLPKVKYVALPEPYRTQAVQFGYQEMSSNPSPEECVMVRHLGYTHQANTLLTVKALRGRWDVGTEMRKWDDFSRWRVAAVGREGFQMTVDLRLVLP